MTLTVCVTLIEQDIRRSGPGREAEVTVLLERHPGRPQPAVSGLHPVPLLRLHVPCHHIRRAARGGHQGQHSESRCGIQTADPRLSVGRNF